MRRDESLLLDILQASDEALQFLAEVTIEQFAASRLHQNAAIYSLQVIGEAASRLSRELRDGNPEIKWSDIIGMRHRLVHDYFEVNIQRIWDTVKQDLPPLIASLQPLIPPT